MFYVVDLLLVVALLFFVFLPITDRRTVLMRIGMIGVIAVLFTVTVIKAHGPQLTAHLPQAVVVSSN